MNERKRYEGELSEPHVDVTGGGAAKWFVRALFFAGAIAGGAWYLSQDSQETDSVSISDSVTAGRE